MKSKYIDFYGGKTRANIGIYDLYPIFFFKCRSCGAVVSFNNAECNEKPRQAFEYFNRRKDQWNMKRR